VKVRDFHPATEKEIDELEAEGLLTKAEANRLQLNLADEVFIMIAVDEKRNVRADLIGSEKLAIKKYGRERVLGRA
jgi:transcriptional regulator CtsR